MHGVVVAPRRPRRHDADCSSVCQSFLRPDPTAPTSISDEPTTNSHTASVCRCENRSKNSTEPVTNSRLPQMPSVVWMYS